MHNCDWSEPSHSSFDPKYIFDFLVSEKQVHRCSGTSKSFLCATGAHLGSVFDKLKIILGCFTKYNFQPELIHIHGMCMLLSCDSN